MREGALDLHTHSNASDGKTSPPQLVQEVLNRRLRTFALTDHDTTSGIEAISMVYEKLFQLGVELPDFIPGVELSVDFEDQEIHLLGYYPSGMIHCLDGFLDERRRDREARNRQLCENAQAAGLNIHYRELENEGGGTIGRVHMAQLMIRKGYVNSVDEAFDLYLGEGKPVYVKRVLPDAGETMKQIINTGGVPVLAHPAIYKGWLRGPEPLGAEGVRDKLDSLKTLGLQGVEVIHGETMRAESEVIARLAADLELLPTTGSDYHGSHKPNVHLWQAANDHRQFLARYYKEFED